jgi:hypothetical protein
MRAHERRAEAAERREVGALGRPDAQSSLPVRSSQRVASYADAIAAVSASAAR